MLTSMRRILLVTAGMAALLLAGCAPSGSTAPSAATGSGSSSTPGGTGAAPRDQPSTSGTETPIALPRDLSCVGGEDLAVDGQGREFHVTGDCGAVTVHGQGLDIEIAAATSLSLDG